MTFPHVKNFYIISKDVYIIALSFFNCVLMHLYKNNDTLSLFERNHPSFVNRSESTIMQYHGDVGDSINIQVINLLMENH